MSFGDYARYDGPCTRDCEGRKTCKHDCEAYRAWKDKKDRQRKELQKAQLPAVESMALLMNTRERKDKHQLRAVRKRGRDDMAMQGSASKYHNVKTVVDGIEFDSKTEAERYRVLLSWEKSGAIQNLRRQVKYVLIPRQDGPDGRVKRDENGKQIGNAIKYVADFVYIKDGKTIVEDVKGMRTPVYILKRRLMYDRHGIIVREVK